MIATNFRHIYAWGKLWTLSPLKEYALSFLERRKLEIWMLKQLYPDLMYNRKFSRFLIPLLLMPSSIEQEYSSLLVILPIKNDEDSNLVYPNICPSSFYLPSQLKDLNGNYVMDEMRGFDINFELFNDKLDRGFARFLLPIHNWSSSWDLISGDNLVDLVDKITYTISQFGRRK